MRGVRSGPEVSKRGTHDERDATSSMPRGRNPSQRLFSRRCQGTGHVDKILKGAGAACLSFHLDKDRFSVNPYLAGIGAMRSAPV